MNDTNALENEVRRYDRARYIQARVAPAGARPALIALAAFNWETARIGEIVSEPLLGEMRLQWWQDSIDGAFAGRSVDHPVLRALAEAARRHDLSLAPFTEILDARRGVLGENPPRDMEALEAFAEHTGGALNALMVDVLAGSAKAEKSSRAAARHAGVARSLSGLLLAEPYHAAGGRDFIWSLDDSRRIGAMIEEHIAMARSLIGKKAGSMLAAMLPVGFAENDLKRLRRVGFDAAHPALNRPSRLTGPVWKALWGRY